MDKQRLSNPSSAEIWDCIVVGGGPVGLSAALFSARHGLRTLLFERRQTIPAGSRAIGITPPGLEVLAELGLADGAIAAGAKIDRVRVYSGKSQLGRVSFADIPSRFPFILALPQIETEALLRTAAHAQDGLDFRAGFEVDALELAADRDSFAAIRAVGSQGAADWFRARLLLACDGSASLLRQLAGRRFDGGFYKSTFIMGDFQDNSSFGGEARLFFTRFGAVESFPLPAGKRRWIVQTPALVEDEQAAADPDYIAREVLRRTGVVLGAQPSWLSPFRVRRNRIDSYWQASGASHIVFAGDAAHLMSPIGGQGMNTGLADAQFLKPVFAALAKGQPLAGLLQDWEAMRARAFASAASRAGRSMGLGIIRGRIGNVFRNSIIRLMLAGPWKRRVPVDYAMLTIPYRNLEAHQAPAHAET